jgi:hypothetical protein
LSNCEIVTALQICETEGKRRIEINGITAKPIHAPKK